MNINLLDQNPLLILCFLLTGVTVYIVLKFTKKWRFKHLPYLVGIGLLAGLMMQFLISLYANDVLPRTFALMVFPFTFSVGLFILVLKSRHKHNLISGAVVIGSLLFSLLIINGYYRFYPTLYSVFNQKGADEFASSHKGVSLHYDATSPAAFDKKSVEGSLNQLSKDPTDGKVYTIDIPGVVSKFRARSAYVYVPAIAMNPSSINLPVIVLTTGFPGLPYNWLGSGLENTMNVFTKRHKGISPLVFMVDNTGSVTNDTECVNSKRGNVETYLSTDVPNYIKQHYEIGRDPSHWAIGGLSMGGMCSIMMALRHPDVYHYFLDFGGELGPEVGSKQRTIDTLFNGSEADWKSHQPSLLLSSNSYKNMGGFFGAGQDDSRNVTNAVQQLYRQSQKAGIESVYELIGGQHTFSVWQQTFKDSLPWISNRLGATECGTICF